MVKERKPIQRVEKERVDFKHLMIANPNYFGTFPEVNLKPVKPMKGNTKYEELRCIGFYPDSDLLEAIIDVKLSYGYKGSLCQSGSFEYVRFYVDWNGNGDFSDAGDDAGIAGVIVHDIPGGDAACVDKTKPLSYAVSVKIDPKKFPCTLPNLVRVRAILSWDTPPPAGNPNYPPVWGNVLEKWIQIKPKKFLVKDIVKVADLEKLKVEPSMLDLDLAVSKAEAATPEELKAAYEGKDVPEHRLNLKKIQEVAESIKADPSQMVKYKLAPTFKDLMKYVELVLAEKPSVKYEELRCLGLDYDIDHLVATLTLKLPCGYSGGLCTKGSYEFVAFWAYVWDEIEQSCHWKYLGTSSVNVHDIKNIPPEGLQYAVFLPVDFSRYRAACAKPKIIKVRAILSWQTPPSSTNPDYNPVWGNRVEALVQLKPGPAVKDEQIPFINFVGGMAVSKISGNSETAIPSALGDGYANGVNALESPFGGVISICGRISNPPDISGGAPKLNYKVQYKKAAEAVWHDIQDTFRIYISTWNGTTWSQSSKTQVAPGGYYEYEEDLTAPVQRFIDGSDWGGGSVVTDWHTPVSGGDGLYEVRMLLLKVGAPPAPDVPPDHISSNVIKVMIDNTGPDAAVSLDLGACTKYSLGDPIDGRFTATDTHIWFYSLVVEPSVPNPPAISPVSETYPALPAPGTIDHSFHVTTAATTTPCGYVVHLGVRDRTIVNNYMHGHYKPATVGFCLLD
jgi:hypothetical protein